MQQRERLCGLGTHKLVGDGVLITDSRYIKLIKLYNHEYRPNWLICETCVEHVKRTYKYKLKRKLTAIMQNGTDVSSLRSSRTTSNSSVDSIDRIVLQTPKNPNLTNHSKTQNATKTSNTSSDSSDANKENTLRNYSAGSSSQSLSEALQRVLAKRNTAIPTKQPTTLAVLEKVTEQADEAHNNNNVPINVNADDDDYEPSPNLINGVRLPHVQPIIKKRKQPIPSSFDYNEFIRNSDIRGG